MRIFKRSLVAAMLAVSTLAGAGATPLAAAPATVEEEQGLPPGTYEVRDGNGRLVGYVVVDRNGNARLYVIREVQQA